MVHVLEPLKGYLILGKKQYEIPNKYSFAWNFGTIFNSVTSVKTIVEYNCKNWGSGKYKIGKSKFYEQIKFTINIKKIKTIFVGNLLTILNLSII